MCPNEFTLSPSTCKHISSISCVCRISGPSTPVHTPVHTIRSCIHVFTPASSFYLGWICLHCLNVSIPIYPVDTCSPLFILPTPVHTCPYLSCLTIIHALYRRSHLPLLALCPCPYIRSFSCVLAPVSGSLGALRLKVRLTEDSVLPSRYYQPLRELLMESVLGPAEVGASLGVCGGDLDHGHPLLWGPRGPGHLSCLLSLCRRMPPAPWLSWRS